MLQLSKWRLITAEQRGDVVVVDFRKPRIEERDDIRGVAVELSALVDELHPAKVIIQFSVVTFLSAGLLGKLISFRKKCKEVDCELVLCGVSKEIMKLFDITRLDLFFSIVRDTDAALMHCEA